MYKEKIISCIQKKMAEQDFLIVGIDGRCGSGKSTMAQFLAEHFDARVIHMDDFYLPIDKRRENWREVPCANMDLQRLIDTVFLPAKKNQEICYQAYRCQLGSYTDLIVEPQKPLTIVEGSYALHPQLAAYYDDTVFMTCSSTTQEKRLKEREQERFVNYQKLWIPLEEAYYKETGVESCADYFICTDEESE